MNAIKRWFVKWSAEEQFRNVNARMPEVIRACNALDAALRRGESGELEKQAVMTQFQYLVKASRGQPLRPKLRPRSLYPPATSCQSHTLAGSALQST